MSCSLYDAVVPNFLQTLGMVSDLLDKAQAHCSQKGVAEQTLLDARLAPDMFALPFQTKSCAVHTIGAIEGVRVGVFRPDREEPPASLAGLKAQVVAARTAVAALSPAEINGFAGRDMRFEVGDFILPFTAENFLLSFSIPNLYFHATIAYAILRNQGVEIGKRDFLGQMRLKA